MATAPRNWSNRIVGHEIVPADQLLANPQNWRIHPKNQQSVMEGVLDELGWIDEVKVSQRSGLIIDGHMRASLAIARDEEVPVAYLDLTPEEEALALATYNPIGALAVPDEKMLNEVIGQIDIVSPEVATFLDGLTTEVNQAAIKSTKDETGLTNDDEAGEMKVPTLRVLMKIPDIAILEQAILKTGAGTRGEALLELAKAFIHGNTQGQQHKRR